MKPLFHTLALAATVLLAVTAWFVTRDSLRSFITAMRFRLAQTTSEAGTLYTEVT